MSGEHPDLTAALAACNEGDAGRVIGIALRSDEMNDAFCGVCTNGRDADRHHGVAAVGRTSWGDEVRL